MKIKLNKNLFFCLLPLFVFLLTISVRANDTGLSAEVYAQRRAALIDLLPDNSMAIFLAARIKTRSNDVTYEFRQDNSLFYLTGSTDLKTALIITKEKIEIDGQETNEVFFVPPVSRFWVAIEGENLSADAAKTKLGYSTVKVYDELNKVALNLLEDKKQLFYTSAIEFLHEELTGERYFIHQKAKKWLRQKFPGLKVKSAAKYLTQLRQIKSEPELALLQRAIDITCDAHLEAMRRAAPGIFEYQLEAAIEYVFREQGADYPAFPSIVGSGPNSTILHYSKNTRQLGSDDLIVIDIGAEYRGYSADVTRTIPSSGKFNKQQKEIYEIVLAAQAKAIEAIKPGVPFREVHTIAKNVIDKAGYGQYFTHGTSHYLGLDTHDVGDRGPLQAGMVITVEPGIYIKEGAPIDKRYWNIGVRIEDDVLVTEDGYKLLSTRSPSSIAEIEKRMQAAPEWTQSIH